MASVWSDGLTYSNLQVSIPVEYIETVETTADGGEIHIAHSGGELEGSTVILDPVLQVRIEYSMS